MQHPAREGGTHGRVVSSLITKQNQRYSGGFSIDGSSRGTRANCWLDWLAGCVVEEETEVLVLQVGIALGANHRLGWDITHIQEATATLCHI